MSESNTLHQAPSLSVNATSKDIDLEANQHSADNSNTMDQNTIDNNDSGGLIRQPSQFQPESAQRQQSENKTSNFPPAELIPEKIQPRADEAQPTRRAENTVSGMGIQPQAPPAAVPDTVKKKPEKDGTSNPNKTNGWRDVYNSYKELDNDWAQSINDDISTLLLFAGLFATVLTAFLVEVYGDLEPDNTKLSAPILVDISKQLHALSLGQAAVATTVSLARTTPTTSRVATTVLWLLSLILSLGAALFGILIKQWVREYMRWTSVYPLQHALHIRYHRKENRDRWHIEGTIVIVWTSLVLSLIFFFFGLAVLSFDVDLTIGVIATAVIAMVLLAVLNTTFTSVFDPTCPYRTPFSSSIFILVSYTLSKFAPTARAIVRWCRWISWRKLQRIIKRTNGHEDADQLERNSHRMESEELISSVEKLWGSQDKMFWVENVWSEWDKVLYLSHDVKERVLVGWEILVWLVGHLPVSNKDSLVVQCFSDLPGPSPSELDQENNTGTDLRPRYNWRGPDNNRKPKLQFESLCQVLIHSLPDIKTVFKSPLDNSSDLAGDLPEFLNKHVWNIYSTPIFFLNDDQRSIDVPFRINLGYASRLHLEMQSLDFSTGNLLLKCISWLTETVFTNEGQHALKKVDLDFFASLLGIYFMLVDRDGSESGKSDLYDTYHRMMVNILSMDQSTRRGASDAPESSTPVDIQGRIEFAGNLLSFSSSTSHFNGTRTQRLEVGTIILYITAAAQFFDRWKMKKPKGIFSEAPETTEDDKAGCMPTKVFWALATIVFDTGNRRWDELNKRNDYCEQIQPFIRAIQQVLRFEAKYGIKWEDGDSRNRGEMTSFLILSYRSFPLPAGFFDDMKTASNRRILDIEEMVVWSGRWLASPISAEWIETGDEYLNTLQKL